MEFYTAFNEKRPVRLSENTRRFAWESMNGKYGDEAMQTLNVAMDDVSNFTTLSENKKYDLTIAKIASEAPIRICENELVSGAATLGGAIFHNIPASFNNNTIWSSVSHVTLGFDKVIKQGINSFDKDINERLCHEPLSDSQKDILISMQNTISSMRVWHKRYLDELKDTKPDIYKNLLNVPFEPARNFYEAVQSLWFTFSFIRLCGNWPGIGRIDEMLGPYLKQDLEEGLLTIDSAREILASFFIKGCEWIRKDTPVGSGDAQHYQNIVLSGIDVTGNDVTNEVTYLILDVVEELGISDFPISVRLNENTPERLLNKVAQVIRHGGGIVAVYNETLIINSMLDFGYSLEEARRFANDGCWEVQVPGKTYFTYHPFDSLQILLKDTLGLDDTPKHFNNIQELYNRFKSDLENDIEEIYYNTIINQTGQVPGVDWQWSPTVPCSVVSLFTEGCIESGLSYLGGGARYTVLSPHIGGAPDVGNSLYAIQKLVFDEKKVTFGDLMTILQNNWEGNESLRQYVLNNYCYYGNDNDEADRYTTLVLNDFADIVSKLNGRSPILFPAGVSTFGRQIEWAPQRAAVPFGRKKGEILSSNISPTPGTDVTGATAVIKSYCKADLSKQTNGAALDIKLYPSTVQGKNGVDVLVGLLQGFLKLGGFFMQLDVVDANILKQAQDHPEDYKTLSVRVSGWNARFVTLNRQWQNMIIDNSTKGL